MSLFHNICHQYGKTCLKSVVVLGNWFINVRRDVLSKALKKAGIVTREIETDENAILVENSFSSETESCSSVSSTESLPSNSPQHQSDELFEDDPIWLNMSSESSYKGAQKMPKSSQIVDEQWFDF